MTLVLASGLMSTLMYNIRPMIQTSNNVSNKLLYTWRHYKIREKIIQTGISEQCLLNMDQTMIKRNFYTNTYGHYKIWDKIIQIGHQLNS